MSLPSLSLLSLEVRGKTGVKNSVDEFRKQRKHLQQLQKQQPKPEIAKNESVREPPNSNKSVNTPTVPVGPVPSRPMPQPQSDSSDWSDSEFMYEDAAEVAPPSQMYLDFIRTKKQLEEKKKKVERQKRLRDERQKRQRDEQQKELDRQRVEQKEERQRVVESEALKEANSDKIDDLVSEFDLDQYGKNDSV